MAGIAFKIDRDELHERLGGELPRGALGLAEGEPGSGRSVLMQRLVYGALANDYKCAYLTTEHSTTGFLRQMHTLGYDVGPRVATSQLLLLTGFPAFGARAPPGDVLARLAQAKAMWEREFVVIDDFGLLLQWSLEARGEGETRALADQIAQRIRQVNARGATVILTADRDGPHAPLLQPVRASAEILLSLSVELVGASLARRMLVKRLAGVPDRTGDTMGFRVEPGMGILVEIRSVT
ncbi:MAG TPA: ATPase domain-containing protein [Candidatus Thermoplasmatota archaeon]|jgi:flagellar protein FlaH|nr:ATPase domain-containing protein [Candidatus Thermoplasmatota archaeon]